MPRLALISPKGADFARDGSLSEFLQNEPRMRNIRNLWNSPNLGLLTIAALTPSHWDIEYIDEHLRAIDFDRQYDIVGISCMTQQIERGYEIARIFQQKGILTVIGGIHATVCPEEVAEVADVVVAGEAELLWPMFIQDWESGKFKRIYKEGNPGRLDMRISPFPRYDIIKDYNYSTITVHTSRGCPHDCSFCAASRVYGPVYRRKTNEQIISELILIKEHFENKYVLFGDDNIFVSREESKSLLREIKKLNIRWVAQTDISIADDMELVQLMADSGCQWVVIGLESVSRKSLEKVNKWKTKQHENYKESINKIQGKGIGVMGAFVFGLDYDDESVLEDTIQFIEECNFYGIHVTTPTPFPGARFRNMMIDEGRLLDLPWSYYTHWDVLIQPKHMSSEELHDCIVKIYKTFTAEENVNRRFQMFIQRQRNLIQS
ncbi:radical SAM protein [Paenibacillus sp. M1]|uniref:Radical SAM protein n=1 Tax=Paenibacillus haidiansis TaxID=1574488 RepID=A0ABU7VQA1_9BACL